MQKVTEWTTFSHRQILRQKCKCGKNLHQIDTKTELKNKEKEIEKIETKDETEEVKRRQNKRKRYQWRN